MHVLEFKELKNDY